eukprot:6207764-Pleurochrysis_carterae.AAC.1
METVCAIGGSSCAMRRDRSGEGWPHRVLPDEGGLQTFLVQPSHFILICEEDDPVAHQLKELGLHARQVSQVQRWQNVPDHVEANTLVKMLLYCDDDRSDQQGSIRRVCQSDPTAAECTFQQNVRIEDAGSRQPEQYV